MSKYNGGTDYRKYALVLELLGLAHRITKSGYKIRFVKVADEEYSRYKEERRLNETDRAEEENSWGD